MSAPPSPAGILSKNNEVFSAYAFYSALLVLKLFAMTVLTARQRFAKKAFANPEDLRGKNAKVKLDDPDVERVRRAHLNDLENIPAFWITGLLFCLTNPSPALAVNLFRTFTACRFAHTVVYAIIPLQPFRALAFFGGIAVTFYMAVSTLLHFA